MDSTQDTISLKAHKGTPFLTAYSATKFAIRGLTQTAGKLHFTPFKLKRGLTRSIHIAIELGKHQITVNAYAPGIIHTPMALLPDGTDDRGATAKRVSVHFHRICLIQMRDFLSDVWYGS